MRVLARQLSLHRLDYLPRHHDDSARTQSVQGSPAPAKAPAKQKGQRAKPKLFTFRNIDMHVYTLFTSKCGRRTTGAQTAFYGSRKLSLSLSISRLGCVGVCVRRRNQI